MAAGTQVLRRDPDPTTFQKAIEYLEENGFKCTLHRFGPKVRCDLSWPDERRGIRLPEWRVVQIYLDLIQASDNGDSKEAARNNEDIP